MFREPRKNLVLRGHTDAISSLAWASGGETLVSGSFDRTIRVWDFETGKPLRQLTGHRSWVSAVAVSAASNEIISVSSDRSIRVWDPNEGLVRSYTDAHERDIWALAVSPDGRRIITGGHDRALELRDLATGQLLARLLGHTNTVLCAAFSPDGRQVVSGSDDHTVRVWYVETGEEVRKLPSHESSVRAVLWMPDGQIISASMDKTIRMHGEKPKVLRRHAEAVGALAASPDGNLFASASFDGTVRIWDTAMGTALQSFKEECTKFPVGLAFHPSKPFLAAVGGQSKDIHLIELTGAVAELWSSLSSVSPSVESITEEPEQVRFRYAAFVSFHRDVLPIASIIRDQLVKTLQEASGETVEVFLDEIRTGASWMDEVSRALAGSALFVPIMGDSYFGSPACVAEFDAMTTLEQTRLDLLSPGSRKPLMFPMVMADAERLPERIYERNPYWINAQLYEMAESASARASAHWNNEHSRLSGATKAMANRYLEVRKYARVFGQLPAPILSNVEKPPASSKAQGHKASAPQVIEIPKELIENIVAGETVLLVGSAMSSPPLPKGWDGLVLEIVLWAQKRDILSERSGISVLERNDPSEAISALVKEVGWNTCIRALTEILGNDKAPGPAYGLLPDMRFSAVLTMNFDEFLDRTFPESPVFTHADAQALAAARWRNAFFIGKIRGTISRPEAIIFTNSDYSRMKSAVGTFRAELQRIFRTKTVLFIGFGFNDPDLLPLLEEAASAEQSERWHYALMPTRDVDLDQRSQFTKQHGIRILNDNGYEGEPDLYHFLNDLRARVLQARHTTLPEAVESRAYDVAIPEGKGWWRVVRGTLPPGLELDASGGRIKGTPTRAGAYTFELDITISGSSHGFTSPARSYSIEVKPVPVMLYALALQASPEHLRSGQSTTLTVSLQRAAAGAAQLEIPTGTAEVHCFLSAEGFRIEGTEGAALRVGEYSPTVEAEFTLQSRLLGKRTVTVDFYVEESTSQRVRLYSASLAVEVKPAAAAAAQPAILPVLEVRVGPQPDFLLHVHSDLPEGEDGPLVLRYSASTRLLRPSVSRADCGEAVLSATDRRGLRTLLFEMLSDVEGMASADVRERLLTFGVYAGQKLFPASTAKMLHELFGKVGNRVRTWMVSGDESAWLPWELVSLPVEGQQPRLLGEQFRMGRWVEGLGPAPCQQIPVGDLALAHYLRGNPGSNDPEVAAWQALLQADRTAGIAAAVKPETPVFGIHVLRRQSAGDPREIVPRAVGNAGASPEADARTARLDLRAKRPAVGFSVLGTSQDGEALTLDRALPFLRSGASAVTGPSWPTAEGSDQIFWPHVYDLLWHGVPLGEAVWRARLLLREAEPDRADWLSYILVGDPQARPYKPEEGEGYASLEAVEKDAVMVAGTPYMFRVSLRSRPPIWYQDRLIRTEEPRANLTAMFLGPNLGIEPQGPVEMRRSGRTMMEAVASVTAASEGSFPLIAQLLDGDEHVKTLQLTLKVRN